VVVGFDPANHLGVAVLQDGRLAFSYTYDFSAFRGVDRLHRFFCTATDVLHAHRPITLVVIEGYSMGRQGHGTFLAGEYGGLLRTAAALAQVGGVLVVPPMTLKKFATGRRMKFGSGPEKSEVRACVEAEFNTPVLDLDASDALALAWAGQHVLHVGGAYTEENDIRLEVTHALRKIVEKGPFERRGQDSARVGARGVRKTAQRVRKSV